MSGSSERGFVAAGKLKTKVALRFFAYRFPYKTHVLDITSGGIKPRHTVFTPPPPLPPKPKKGKKKAGATTEADIVDALAAEVEAIDLEPEEELAEIDVDAG